MLVGNKKDMAQERAVPTEQARQLAEGLSMKYYETSAKTGEQVNECIEHLVRECLLKVKREIDSTNVDLRGAQ
jgi:GTPase SAR1 family protein